MELIWPWQDRSRRFSWLKASTLALMFVPGLYVIYQVETEQFGAIPIAGMTYWSGVWATALLLLTLAVTPAFTIMRWSQLIVVRRMIGVTALVYSIAHLFIYFALRFWDFSFIANEMITRISLIVATLSTLGLIALGVTSVDAAVRRMGSEGWNRLHATVYIFSALAIIHYLLSPGIYSEQYLMSGMFVWLMVWRVLNRRGIGTDPMVLAVLAVATCLFTGLLEILWLWVYQGFEPGMTFSNNFSLVLGLAPSWKNLILGLLIALAAYVRQTRGLKGPSPRSA